ncbi:MAG: hypothetical protein R3B06_07525 [Kofleriaceae bacterium]
MAWTDLAHGTRLELVDGRVRTRTDRAGRPQANLAWSGDRLATLTVHGLGDAAVTVDGAVVDHPVLGPAHAIRRDDVQVATMSAVAWARPHAIPAIDRPAALPAGCGAMLLDTLARLAQAAGVPALRYAGPYPTAALWASLAHSFTSDGTEAAFTADATARWRGGALPVIPIDFVPAPHERVPLGAGVTAQLRAGVERVIVEGAAFAPGPGVRRLVRQADRWSAALWFGDRPWCVVAELTEDGALVARHPPRPGVGAPAGEVVPPALTAALLELVAAELPPPLTVDALAGVPIAWGDAGLAAAADRGDHVVLHVGLWHHLAPHGLARVALALAEALTPIATARAVAALAGSGGAR